MNQQIGPLSLPTRTTAITAVQGIGFWGSVFLPAAYPPVLYAMSGTEQLLTLAILFAVNVSCLVAGHQYQS